MKVAYKQQEFYTECYYRMYIQGVLTSAGESQSGQRQCCVATYGVSRSAALSPEINSTMHNFSCCGLTECSIHRRFDTVTGVEKDILELWVVRPCSWVGG
jgi:hypothetical protein